MAHERAFAKQTSLVQNRYFAAISSGLRRCLRCSNAVSEGKGREKDRGNGSYNASKSKRVKVKKKKGEMAMRRHGTKRGEEKGKGRRRL